MQCFDWNAVSFGDDCLINGFLQYHSFENMMLKVKRTHIRDGCTVTFGACVMGGAVIGRDTTIMPLALVLKEMYLPTSVYEGSPAEPASGSTLLSSTLPRVGEREHAALQGAAPIDESVEFASATLSDHSKR